MSHIDDRLAEMTKRLPRESWHLEQIRTRARKRRVRRRAGIGVGLCILLVLLGVGVVDKLDRSSSPLVTSDSSTPEPPEPENPPPVAPDQTARIERLEIPVPDYVTQGQDHGTAWTGREVAIWGGLSNSETGVPVASGALYNPADESWREMAASPLAPRSDAIVAWSGKEVLVVGGLDQELEPLTNGAAYDPESDTWRELPEIDIEGWIGARSQVNHVWADKRLVMWDRESGVVISLEPEASDWVELPSLEIPGSFEFGALHWTGTHIIAIANGWAALEPSSGDPWTTLDTVSFGDPFPTNSVVVGDQLLLWSRAGRNDSTVALDTSTLAWDVIDTVPSASCEGHPPPVAMGTQVLAFDLCATETGGAILYDSTTKSWERLELPDEYRVDLTDAVWTGDEVVNISPACCFGTGQPLTMRAWAYRIARG